MMSRVYHQMHRLLLGVLLMTTLCVSVSALKCYSGPFDSYIEHQCSAPADKTCHKTTTNVGGMCMMPNIAYFIYKISNRHDMIAMTELLS